MTTCAEVKSGKDGQARRTSAMQAMMRIIGNVFGRARRWRDRGLPASFE
jgi:hypothetical protein